MILEIYAIHDRVGAFFSAPFFLQNVGLARRTLADIVTDMNTQIARHPHDYSLYHLGSFENESGIFAPLSPPVFICTAASLLPPPMTELPFGGNSQ